MNWAENFNSIEKDGIAKDRQLIEKGWSSFFAIRFLSLSDPGEEKILKSIFHTHAIAVAQITCDWKHMSRLRKL